MRWSTGQRGDTTVRILPAAVGWMFGLGLFIVLLTAAGASVLWRRMISRGKGTVGPGSSWGAGELDMNANPRIVDLGSLPGTPGETCVYRLDPEPGNGSGEVVIVASLDPQSVERGVERCYELRLSGVNDEPRWFWLFCRPFENEPSLSYHRTVLRIPAADHAEFSIRLLDTESPTLGRHHGGMVGIVSRV